MTQKCLGAQLVIERLAGVAPEVNLRNPLDAGDKVCKLVIHSGFETQIRCLRNSKTGYQWSHKRTYVLQKIKTSMHSSRMHNAHRLTVSGGGGGGGVYLPHGIVGRRQTPIPPWTDNDYLPVTSFVGGKETYT